MSIIRKLTALLKRNNVTRPALCPDGNPECPVWH
jgi:hypothetical protein